MCDSPLAALIRETWGLADVLVGPDDPALAELHRQLLEIAGADENLGTSAELTPEIEARISGAFASTQTLALVNALAPRDFLAHRLDAGPRVSGPLALVHLAVVAARSRVLLLVPGQILQSERARSIRRAMSDRDDLHVEWIVYLDNRSLVLPGVHHQFQFEIVCLGPTSEPAAGVTRLVDLRGLDATSWLPEVQAAQRRGGGEVGRSIVLRGATLGEEPWTFARFSRALAQDRAVGAALGRVRPLREVADVRIGLNLHQNREAFVPPLGEVRDEEVGDWPPPGLIPCYGGREPRPDGTLGEVRRACRLEHVPEAMRLRAGDILLCSLVAGRSVRAAVYRRDEPATFDQFLFQIRWSEPASLDDSELLAAWLRSERAGRAFAALGVGLQLSLRAISDLEIPQPSPMIREALRELSSMEAAYRSRADQVFEARSALFSETDYDRLVPRLIATQQEERERLEAADDSQRFDYQVRNYFPHPIALRREFLIALDHGRERLEQTLECGEHLIHLLAVLALGQLRATKPGEPLPSSALRASIRNGDLLFDWGKCIAVAQEGVAATWRSSSPLALPVPGLALLGGSLEDQDSAFASAERPMRKWRNDMAHLQRLPEDQLRRMSEEFAEHLDRLLEELSFLADVQLAHIEDYAQSPLSGARTATVRLLQGASVAFRRLSRTVTEEVPRGALGLILQDGSFCNLGPWLTLRTCEVCKRAEVFLFNRYEDGQATYVAMESGHPLTWPEASPVLASMVSGR